MNNALPEARGWAPAVSPVPEYFGPNGFAWLVPGLLGGAPRPGIFRDLSRDLEALARVNTRLLVTLTEESEPEVDAFAHYGIASHYTPITDMTPPTEAQAVEICEAVAPYLDRGEAVVFHCRAGKGRTGTLLAAQLVWNGVSAADAITRTRASNPKWIETDGQLDFLHGFEAFIKTAR